MEPDLTTSYLGLRLRNPVVVSASPLSRQVASVRRLEDAGAAAVVAYSLFEEEIIEQRHERDDYLERGALTHDALFGHSWAPRGPVTDPDNYVRHIEQLKRAVKMPVIGSLNGVAPGTWLSYARRIEEAGADAIELNIYYLPTDPDLSGAELEAVYVALVRDLCAAVRIPVAVKLSPFFTALPHMTQQFVEAGAAGLVLFNRFYQPDFDLETFDVVPNLELSTSRDLRLPLRWIAILYRRVSADFALTGGVHEAQDVAKAVLAGASVAMLASELLANGTHRLSEMLRDLEVWMIEHDFRSVTQMLGGMSQHAVSEPAAFERNVYIRALNSFRVRRG